MALLDELLASRRRAILVVDNCGSELHGRSLRGARSLIA